MKKNIAVIGCGIWGKNLVRNFYNLGALHTCCDLDEENLINVSKEYIDVKTTSSIEEVLNNTDIEGVAIATPSHTHYKMVKQVLLAGKNAYVEKPLATNSLDAKELNELALSKSLVVMVGHLLLYHPVVNRLKKLVEDGVLGDISYIQSDRLNVNHLLNDKSVMWDLAPHDLSMISYIMGEFPEKVVSAVGVDADNTGMIPIVHLDFEFANGAHAHISNSWIHPVKHVQLIVKGSKATAIFDDTNPNEKLKLFNNLDKGVSNVELPDYIEIEPLKLECQHFLSCIKNRMKSRTDGDNGYETVKLLEEADKIMLGDDYNKVHSFKFASSRKKTKVKSVK